MNSTIQQMISDAENDPRFRLLSLDELAAWSRWPSRLLGLEEWVPQARTVEKVEAEYNETKYSECLRYYEEHPGASIDDIRRFQSSRSLGSEICFSLGSSLYVTDFETAHETRFGIFLSAMRPLMKDAQTIIELGCSYGYNLHLLSKHNQEHSFIGGELSENAVDLGGRLFREQPRIQLRRFNFYDPKSYEFLNELPGPLIVLTVHAIEQLPSCQVVIENLLRFGKRIDRVIHFEPAHDRHDTSLLGLMRQRYTEMNDYNRDLVSVLENSADVQLLQYEPEVVGITPMNPTSIL